MTDDGFDGQLATAGEEWEAGVKSGKYKIRPTDVEDCDFVQVGFRSWGLEASDHTWRLVLSKLDFGAREPSALLTVYAPRGHVNAIKSPDNLVFHNALGTHGGTNWNQCKRLLKELLGSDEIIWHQRLTYLVNKAKQANAGSNNGTFSIQGVPEVLHQPSFVFHGRLREGRTMSIFGPGSAGKTTIVDGLIASACSGTEVVPGWRPSRRYSTLILDWDEGEDEERVRLSAICRGHGVKLEARYHYKRQTRPLHDVADEIGAYIVAEGVELVIVSPVGRAARNMGDNLTAPIDELYEVLRSFGTTNILIDHVTGSNMKGGADREFGSVRKRDNARGSYSLYAQSEDLGSRVIVLKNTKPDALAPKIAPQAVRIDYDPPAPVDGIYQRITYTEDIVIEQPEFGSDQASDGTIRTTLHRVLLRDGHMSTEELATATSRNTASIRTILNRGRDTWFNKLPSGKWEALPVQGDPHNSVT